MKFIQLLLLICLVFTLSHTNAQDIHFSQFNMSPLTLNPANTGAFKGTFRIGGIYRDQWASVIGNQFRTPSFYVDVPAFRGFGKKDWVGIGAYFLNDQSGSTNLRQTTFMGSIAYHLALDNARKNVLTIGGQIGSTSRRFDQTTLIFESDLIGTPVPFAGQDDISYIDYNAGISFRSRLSATSSFNIGAAMYHITEPEDGFLSNGVMPQRLVINAGANFELTETLLLRPMALYQSQAAAEELIIQALFGYKMGESGDFILNFGPGYRLDDAVMAIVGLEFKGLTVGVAYDVNISDLSGASNSQGGFEIAAGYIVRIPKIPTIPPVIFNPRF